MAIRTAEDDGSSMVQLKLEAQQAKRHSIEAEKRASNAADIIQNLNNEINHLKKAFKEANIFPERPLTGVIIPCSRGLSSKQPSLGKVISLETDLEVDDLMLKYASEETENRILDYDGDQYPYTENNSTLLDTHHGFPVAATTTTGFDGLFHNDEYQYKTMNKSDIVLPTENRRVNINIDSFNSTASQGESFHNRSTFQAWKTNKLYWSPDNAAGSEYYDYEANEAAQQIEELNIFQNLDRPTKSRAGKIKVKVFDSASAMEVSAINIACGEIDAQIKKVEDSILARTNSDLVLSRDAKQKQQQEMKRERDTLLKLKDNVLKGLFKPNKQGKLDPLNANDKLHPKMHKQVEIGKGPMPVKHNPLVTSKLFTTPPT